MNLYTSDGWLNFDYIASKGAWLNVIIGARQVGKTYGCLLYLLDNNTPFILLRRTKEEIDVVRSNPDVNPFLPYEPEYHIDIFKDGKLCKICTYILNEKNERKPDKQIGLALGLSQIANVRGFSGAKFTDLVFDEFIPEKGVITRLSEGETFLNAYTTINGNRELNGNPPLHVWLLANSNRVDSPILEALNLTDLILSMRRKNQEELLTDNGVYIVQPKSENVLNRRKETALMKLVSKESDFYNMAIGNEFSYDKSPYVKTLSIKGMTPFWSYDNIYCWNYANGFYICRAPFKSPTAPSYKSGRVDRERLALDFSIMRAYYYLGAITFSDLRALTIFKQIYQL